VEEQGTPGIVENTKGGKRLQHSAIKANHHGAAQHP